MSIGYQIAGRPVGVRYTADDIGYWLIIGRIRDDTLVLADDADEWLPLYCVAELIPELMLLPLRPYAPDLLGLPERREQPVEVTTLPRWALVLNAVARALRGCLRRQETPLQRRSPVVPNTPTARPVAPATHDTTAPDRPSGITRS